MVEPTHSKWLEMEINPSLPPEEEEDGDGDEAIEEDQEDEGKKEVGNLSLRFCAGFSVIWSLTTW